MLKQKSLQGVTVIFLLFVLWIIFSADTGKKNIFFYLVDVIPYGDKIGHFFLFGILTLFLNLALSFKRLRLWHNLHLGTLLVSVFVLLEELSQAFFPNRTLDSVDLLADGLGIIFFTFLGLFWFEGKSFNTKKYN